MGDGYSYGKKAGSKQAGKREEHRHMTKKTLLLAHFGCEMDTLRGDHGAVG
jgi:hypothetical protein